MRFKTIVLGALICASVLYSTTPFNAVHETTPNQYRQDNGVMQMQKEEVEGRQEQVVAGGIHFDGVCSRPTYMEKQPYSGEPCSVAGDGKMACRPSWLIIGAGKCGTSSLYYYLLGHPCMVCLDVFNL